MTASVLLIDADPELHTELAHAVHGEFSFYGAKTVELGLRIASRRPPAVVVVDAHAPGPRIEEVVAALRAVSHGVRLIFVTSHDDPDERARLMTLGPVLPKPFEIDRLKHLVKNAVRLRGMSDDVERLRSRTGQFSLPPPSTRSPPSSSRRATPPPSSQGGSEPTPPSWDPPSSSPRSSRKD
jgi:DNA-binding response OmpR family regulator